MGPSAWGGTRQNTARGAGQNQCRAGGLLRQPQVRQCFGPLGIEPATNAPDEMDKLIADEVLNFKKLAAAAQIQTD